MECQQYGRDSRYLHTLEELFLMYSFVAYGCFGRKWGAWFRYYGKI